ncbi:hypothetical protein RSAG8_05779, partial [Rhizoctonia solani AG-8 WAC10335]
MTNDSTSHVSSMQIDIPQPPGPSKRPVSPFEDPPDPPSTRKTRKRGSAKAQTASSASPAPPATSVPVAQPPPFVDNPAACARTIACVHDTLLKFSDPSVWADSASWGDLARSLTLAILTPVVPSVREGCPDSSALQSPNPGFRGALLC